MVSVAINRSGLTEIQTDAIKSRAAWWASAHYQIRTQRTRLRQPFSGSEGSLLPIPTQQVKTWVLSFSISIQWLCSWNDSFSPFFFSFPPLLLILLSGVLAEAWHWLIYSSKERERDKTESVFSWKTICDVRPSLRFSGTDTSAAANTPDDKMCW